MSDADHDMEWSASLGGLKIPGRGHLPSGSWAAGLYHFSNAHSHAPAAFSSEGQSPTPGAAPSQHGDPHPA